ncbi:hypothetical protein HF086_002304 [Spodoptera exigua]|uniref:Protein FAM114A2 n=1 Tax=Spodoptera exigua TaxID=7107 RepID=A0A922MWB1_SPOEX|nr:hypothetical protein HF086_002304 [Spodoptera exigua]
MATSDSEDFESADEGHGSPDKKERKKRLSSSNYSDNALETEQKASNTPKKSSKVQNVEENVKETDGWDDFDIDDTEPVPAPAKSNVQKQNKTVEDKPSTDKEIKKSQDTGWDDFDDWGEDDTANTAEKSEPKPIQSKPQPAQSQKPEPNIQEVTDRLAAASTGGSGWGWGWSVDSLLSSATAGISTITSQVSQGISTVLETGIGAPDPEELARRSVKNNETKTDRPEPVPEADKRPEEGSAQETSPGDAAFPFGSLISGVTKFVETTGTKVIHGGLDTLETIGKKTMEVLQDGDPGLAKKRAMLGLGTGDKPVLSQVLREAKAKAEEEDKVREEKREAKEVHYENLFDDFEEALEMLSRQVSMRIEERIRSVDVDKRQDIKETLQQVAELCEMPEEDDDDDEESPSEDLSKPDAFHERLQTATQDLGLKLQFQALVKMTVVLTKHISELATLFTEKLNALPSDNKEQVNTYITNIFLEAGNSSTYIQNAFQLALPILQIGAV